jgi:hypothetical protein
MKCSCCDGRKGWRDDYGCGFSQWQDCPVCHATGKIGFMTWLWDWAPTWIVGPLGDLLYWWYSLTDKEPTE